MSVDGAEADRLLGALRGCTAGTVPIAVGVLVGGSPAIALEDSSEGDRFEFGSITKTMTAQVLATLVAAGCVAFDDEISRWLDAGPNGSITLEQLARHRSGLPRLAPNADAGDAFDQLDPYAIYSADMAEAALRLPVSDPNRSPVYSNFGYQLLGLALERAADATLVELLAEHVFEPFGLRSASIGPHRDLVQGHRQGRPTPAWTMRLNGPGGVVGTIEDLLAWGAAVAHPPAGRHGDALRTATKPWPDEFSVGLAWQLHRGLIWHNGGTYGFKACLAIDRDAERVAATLVGTSDIDHVDEATFLAARGLNPFDARPEPADSTGPPG